LSDRLLRSFFFDSVALKSPWTRKICDVSSLFWALFAGFIQEPAKNTLEKEPFLLVRFLWANKENEQDKSVWHLSGG